jgi:hypothetical protein
MPLYDLASTCRCRHQIDRRSLSCEWINKRGGTWYATTKAGPSPRQPSAARNFTDAACHQFVIRLVFVRLGSLVILQSANIQRYGQRRAQLSGATHTFTVSACPKMLALGDVPTFTVVKLRHLKCRTKVQHTLRWPPAATGHYHY